MGDGLSIFAMTTLGEASAAAWQKAQRFPVFLGGVGCLGTLFCESLLHVGEVFFCLWLLLAMFYVLVVPGLLGLLFVCEWFLDQHDPDWRNRTR